LTPPAAQGRAVVGGWEFGAAGFRPVQRERRSILTIEAVGMKARTAGEVSLYFGAARAGVQGMCWRNRQERRGLVRAAPSLPLRWCAAGKCARVETLYCK